MKYMTRVWAVLAAVLFAAQASAQCVPNLDVAGLIAQNSANFIDASSRGISPDDGIDDTANINATFAELAAKGGGTLAITKPGVYFVGGTAARKYMPFNINGGITYQAAVVMPSKTSLYLAKGVVLALAASSNCVLIGNSDPTGRNTDIAIYGDGEIRCDTTQGIISSAPDYWPGHIVVLVGVDRLYVGGGLRFNTSSSGIKYAIEASDIFDAVFDRITFDEAYSDCLHLETGDRIAVSNISAKPVSGHGDQVIAFGTSNGGVASYYPEIVGSVDTTPRSLKNVTVRNVFLNGAYQAFRFFGRVTDTIDDVLIDGVTGTVSNGVVVSYADDPNGSGELVGCRMSNMRLANIFATPSAGNKTVGITARNCTDVTIDGGGLDSAVTANVGAVVINQGSSSYPVAFTSASWTNGSLTLTKTGAFAKTVVTPSTVAVVTAGTNTTTGVYRVVSKTSSDAVVLDRTLQSTPSASGISFVICNLAEVKINNYNTRDGIIGKFVEVASNASGYGAAAQRIVATNCNVKLAFDGASTFGRVYSTGYADNFALETVWRNPNVTGVYLSGTAPNSVQGWDFGPTTFPTYHTVSGLTVRQFGSSSIVFRNQGTTTTLDASDWTISNISGNVFQVTTASTSFRVRGSGGYTPIGSFTPTFCSGATQVLSIDWPNFQVDAHKICATVGDRVYNTNASATYVPAGVGPVRAVRTVTVAPQYASNPAAIDAVLANSWAADTVNLRTSTKTADYGIHVGETNTTFNNSGAAARVVFGLPTATVGQSYRFKVTTAQSLSVQPNGSDTIGLPSSGTQQAAGASIATATAGGSLWAVCDVAGTWSIYGGSTATWTAQTVASKTTGYTVLNADDGTLLNNSGAAGSVTFTLPAWSAAKTFKILSVNAQAIVVAPNGTDTIALPSTGTQKGAGVSITATGSGSSVLVTSGSSGTWLVTQYNGTWN